jgi:pimeloyl-ACP methyl ester carboxylesterase
MPYATSGSANIYYEQHGKGPAVLFIHGSGGHHAAWWQQVSYFSTEYQVITIDLRGFGKSSSIPEGPDAQDFPQDILAVLDHAGVARTVLVGQSIGAAAALSLAVRHPDRASAVVLAHSVGGISHPDVVSRVRADRAEAEKLPVLDRLLTPQFQLAQPAKTFLFQQLGTFNTAKMKDLRNLTAAGPSVEQVNAAGFPICLLSGENDAVVKPATIRHAQQLLEHATLVVVPRAPHSMYWEAPDLFNAALHVFLKAIYVTDPALKGPAT